MPTQPDNPAALCENCDWAVLVSGTTYTCRRWPPTPPSVWPTCEATDWCGEFKWTEEQE